MRINHNIAALNTYNKLSANNATTSKSLEKLSSGLKINKAGDDAAGLAISEKMRGQIRGLDMASKNASDGISMIATAEGALSETHSILQRMRELAVQASNDTNTSSDRTEIQKEVDQLTTEITRISTDTEFNTRKLLNGSMGKTLTPTVNTAELRGATATGTSLIGGDYHFEMTAAGTDTIGSFTNSASGTLVVGDITLDATAKISYGDYRLDISSYNGVAKTATFTLTGPDGETTVMNNVNTEAAINNLGGIDIAAAAGKITDDGSVTFQLYNNGLKVDLTSVPPGGTAANMTANTHYTGEALSVGGFEFSLKTNHGANATDFDTKVTDNSVKFQIGANANQTTSLSINNMDATALDVNSLDMKTQSGAASALAKVDTALNTVSSERAKLGAVTNRLEHTINNLGTTSENLSASESRIRDVDMAKEMMEFTKNNILSQAAQAMLAQANQQPQSVLQLLQ